MPTRRQLALVHVAKRRLRLSDDLYRDILREQGGVESARDLDQEGFERVMQRMKELGFRVVRDQRPGALPTPLQLRKIRHLWEDLGWRESERRVGFCRRVTGQPWPQDREQANQLIEALKSMVRRGYRERVPRRPGTGGSASGRRCGSSR